MRILWFTNIPVGNAGKLFYGKQTNGLWMDAALAEYVGDKENSLFVATTGNTKHLRCEKDDIATYYLLPDKQGYDYRCGKSSNIAAMKTMIQQVKPDIIQIWGMETQAAADIMAANTEQVPVVVYIQGVTASLSRYLPAGLTHWEILGNYTLSDILLGSGIFQQMHRYDKLMQREKTFLSKVKNVIGENVWSQAYYRASNPDIHFYACPLHLSRCFSQYHWSMNDVNTYSIMCNSSNYSIKGVHILLKALYIVKKRYPDTKLYLPGNHPAGRAGVKAALMRSGYCGYVKKLIKKLKLEANVVFLPFLSQEQMAQQMSRSHVFVVPSAIENHSSSLKEAMLVGVPSIGTYVGGVAEYVRHGENGFMYRFEEPEVLADLICRIFDDPALAQKLSQNAHADMQALHIDNDLHGRTLEIYRSILKEK